MATYGYDQLAAPNPRSCPPMRGAHPVATGFASAGGPGEVIR
jgi:hypothetical protein